MHGNHIHITLAQNQRVLFAVFGKVQGKQLVGLFVHQRVAGVDILGLAVIQHAAAKGDHIAPHINNGGHDPVAEVVIIPFLPFSGQPGVYQFCRLVALGTHMLEQCVPLIGGKTQTKMIDRGGTQCTTDIIIIAHLALRGQQHAMVKASGLSVHLQDPATPFGQRVVKSLLGHLQPCPLGQGLNCVQIV